MITDKPMFNELRQLNFDETVRRLDHWYRKAQENGASEAQKQFAMGLIRSLVLALATHNSHALLYFEEDN